MQWQTFGPDSTVRQWVAFPAFGCRLPERSRHLRRSLLVEFREGGIWLFRSPLPFAWPGAALARTAATCQRFLRRPRILVRELHSALAETIEAPFEIVLPELDIRDPGLWNVRTVVLEWLLARQRLSPAGVGGDDRLGHLEATARCMEAQLAAQLATSVEAFLARLDGASAAMASTRGVLSAAGFNALAGTGIQAHRNRRQFIGSFPLFARTLAIAGPSGSCPPGLREAVDRGVPMVEFLSRAFGVRAQAVRFLAGKTEEDTGARWSASPGRLLRLLDALPPEWYPADRQSWQVLDRLVATAEERALRPVSRALARAALQALRRQAADVRRTGHTTTHDWAAEIVSVTEFWASLEDCLRTRAQTTHRMQPADDRIRLRALADSAVAGRGWASLVRLARDWRTAAVGAQAAVQPARERLLGLRFEPLLPTRLVTADRVLVPLETAEELQAEGARLRHCIAGYAAACARGGSYIVSLRDRITLLACSTAEFRISHDRPGPVALDLVQHHALANARPAPECAAAVRWLLDMAPLPALQQHWLTLLARRRLQCGHGAAAATRLAAILAHEQAFGEVLRPAGRYGRLLEQLVAAGLSAAGNPAASG